MALGAQRKEVLQAALGPAFKLLAVGSAAGLLLGILAPGAGFHRVSGNSPRSGRLGRRCSCYVIARVARYVDSSATRAVD
jgi:hypothetical protein